MKSTVTGMAAANEPADPMPTDTLKCRPCCKASCGVWLARAGCSEALSECVLRFGGFVLDTQNNSVDML